MALGNMAVDAHARGQGLMSLLMQDAVERCRREGYDLAVLGGQRQRYARFGFEGNCADRTFRLTGGEFQTLRYGDVGTGYGPSAGARGSAASGAVAFA